VAGAQPAGAQAEVLFKQGRELLAAGKIPEACAAFEASQKLEPAVTTLLNLAGCREKNNQIATAWGLFLEAERQTRSASDDVAKQLHDVAQERAKNLEQRVSKLTISVPAPSQVDGLEITRGSERIDGSLWNRALPIDGGDYTISAHAPGTNTWSTSVKISAQGDTKTVEVPVLSRLPVPVEVRAPPPDVTEAPAQSSSNVAPIAVGASAAVLLGGALGLELWGESQYDDAKAEMTNQTRRNSLVDSANTKRLAAQGLAVIGVGAGVAAVWLYLRNRGHDEPATTRSSLLVYPSGVAVLGTF
jgi:hypothetical protein